MKLLTKPLLKYFQKIGNQSENADPLVICKFFNPTGAGTWYATEFDEENGIFFGYVSIFGDWNDEWGNFALSELESFRWKFGLGIERDIHFDPKQFSELGIDSQNLEIDADSLVIGEILDRSNGEIIAIETPSKAI